jgi:hypothetical protein
MSDVVPLALAPTHRGPTKFTPANIRQITNLLERGKSKDEIAEIIGVTPASLQVTCSKLGISLRRPHVGGVVSGTRRPRPQNGTSSKEVVRERQQVQETPHANGTQSSQDSGRELNDQERDKQTHAAIEAKPQAVLGLRPEPQPVKHAESRSAALTVFYKGKEKTADLPLDRGLLGQFSLEAEFRSMSVVDLIGKVLLSISQNDLFDLVLEKSSGPSKTRIGAQ